VNDRLVAYIVIPKSLKMGIGKVGATCGHAAQLLMQSFEARKPIPSSAGWSSPAYEEDMRALATFLDWLASDYGKIVLGASDEEFAEVRKLPNIITVVDIGLKQVAPGSVTAVGLWPMLKSDAPDVIKGLEPLR
jgi:peptidyl-tRNA hydrolase